MKKLLFFAFLLVFSIFGFSQTFLLEEYFNDPVNLPYKWKTIDKDGDTYNWRINTSGTEIFAVSDSWRSGGIGPLKPENYLISPKVDLTGLSGTVKLRYTIQIPDPVSFEEHYKVALSTTGNSADDFTNTLLEETCTNADYYETFPYWHERIVDLSPFIGHRIYLTWCHFSCTDLYQLALDSIQVSYSTNVNLANGEQPDIILYPNPAKGNLLVTGFFESAEVLLFTSDGRQVYRSPKESRRAIIDVSDFETGVYILRINSQKGLITKKINIFH